MIIYKPDWYGLLVVLLTSIFAAGKVFGFIAWSWWWVFSPVLITIGVGIGALILIGVLFLFLAILNKVSKW